MSRIHEPITKKIKNTGLKIYNGIFYKHIKMIMFLRFNTNSYEEGTSQLTVDYSLKGCLVRFQ